MERKITPSGISPLVRTLYASPKSGPEIEAESFAVIDREAPPHPFPPAEWAVVRRMIHTCGDFAILERVRFSPAAVPSALAAFREGRPIYADSRMIRSGLSLARLRAVHPSYDEGRLFCHVADEDVALQAGKSGLPRAIFAVRKAAAVLHGGIALFGNSPAGLLELNRLILEKGVRPALVVAMPVGFVHVLESKAELTSLSVPHIVLEGRRGGSPLAVSVVHALCGLAKTEG